MYKCSYVQMDKGTKGQMERRMGNGPYYYGGAKARRSAEDLRKLREAVEQLLFALDNQGGVYFAQKRVEKVLREMDEEKES